MRAAITTLLITLLICVVLFCAPFLSRNGRCAAQTPGKDGAKIAGSANEVVNLYTRLTADAPVSSTQLAVASVAGIASGDLVMLYQAQGATISTANDSTYGAVTAYNTAGNYEWVGVASVNAVAQTLQLTTALAKGYSVAGNTQVIRVPQYSSLTVNSGASLTAPAWDGQTGGVVAIHVAGAATITGAITATAKGFRGGALDNTSNSTLPNAILGFRSASTSDGESKGESIAGAASMLANGGIGRGAPANGGGGGNSHNAGGGGGANGNNGSVWTGHGVMPTTCTGCGGANSAWRLDPGWFVHGGSVANSSGGGRGGYSYSATDQNAQNGNRGPGRADWGGDYRQEKGGRGGHPLTNIACQTLFFGGGGGAGDANNGVGGAGGIGGGIVMIAAQAVSGNGTITVNGGAGAGTTGAGNDAPGGGGGGGSILVNASSITVSMAADGGAGGNQVIGTAEAEGPGGGGGGGYILISLGSPTRTANGGAGGTTTSSSLTEFPRNGATNGASGLLATGTISCLPLPVELAVFSARRSGDDILLTWRTATEVDNYGFDVQRSTDLAGWTAVGFVPGSGTASQPNNYRFLDPGAMRQATGRELWYRLRQIDRDGSQRLYAPVAVAVDGAPQLVLSQNYPNPAERTTVIGFRLPEPSPVRLSVFDALGRETIRLLDGTMLQAGSHEISFDGSRLPAGIYLYRISTPKASVARTMRAGR